MKTKLINGLGIISFLLGLATADSDWLIVPVALVSIGLFILIRYEEEEDEL